MILLVLAIHILLAIAIVGVVLMQKSEGGALGSLGGGGGMSGFMTGRSTSNLLTKATAILFALFVVTSISLVMMSTGGHRAQHSILGGTAPPAGSATPVGPSVPLAH
ncbi:MAG TPA: preprotein translocase subunit SecG [Stellaceae bacterium]|nr:preprotein translocase subunit SecG [Stellaceae bacterium]